MRATVEVANKIISKRRTIVTDTSAAEWDELLLARLLGPVGSSGKEGREHPGQAVLSGQGEEAGR